MCAVLIILIYCNLFLTSGYEICAEHLEKSHFLLIPDQTVDGE